ncbi:4442_t:CDS:10 [Cetraspora pellucida]|uniref:4442_t:CDS:1 n=1 Tax=Cetraspora pellucida TaxID=1433469 RepID=A0A9N9GAC4_9GLOM|nr:4442_t:CDS:10 [Cetraspora pellucida]
MSHNHTSDPQSNTSEVVQDTNNVEVIEEIEGSSGQTGGSQTLGEFYKEVNSITEMIRSIRENIAALRDLYKRTLTVETEDERMSRQIDLLISETSRVSSQISHKLAVMEQSNKSLEGQDQARKRLTQHATLAKSFMDEMSRYRRMQMENAEKYRNKIKEQYFQVNPDATQEEINQLIDNDINKTQSSEQSDQSRTILTEIQDRQRDVRRIEKSINDLENLQGYNLELNKMFSEVQALVIEKDDTVHTTKFIEVTDISPSEQIEYELPKKKKRSKLMIMIAIILILLQTFINMLKSLRKIRKNNNDTLCLYPASFQGSNTETVNDYIVAPEVYDADATDMQQWSQPQTNPVILESTSGSSQSPTDVSQWSRNPFKSHQQPPFSSSHSRPSQQEYTSTNDYYASSKQPESNFSMWLNPNADQNDLSFLPFGQTTDNLPEEKVVYCSNCTYFVRPNRTTCEICGTSIKKEETVLNDSVDYYWIKETEEEDDDLYIDVLTTHARNDTPDAAIRCSACSYLNNPTHSQCEMCYSPIGDLEFLNVPDLDMQQCPICTYYNQKDMTTCEICGSYMQQLVTILNTRMTVLEPANAQYAAIYGRFIATMPNVRVLAIILMQMPTRLFEAHERYKNNLARQHQRTPANVTHKMFHGTKCICDPGRYIRGGQWNYCHANTRCGVCGIAQNGNSSAHGRCGGGRMWFAQQSNISYGYCSNTQIKTMYTVDVVSLQPPTASILIVDRNEATLVESLILFEG